MGSRQPTRLTRRVIEGATWFKQNDGRLVQPPFVYFLRSGNFIKIGTTKGDPDDRVADLKVACAEDASLYAVIPGGHAVEKAWHARFADIRASGEWFLFGLGVKRALAEVRPASLKLKAVRKRLPHPYQTAGTRGEYERVMSSLMRMGRYSPPSHPVTHNVKDMVKRGRA